MAKFQTITLHTADLLNIIEELKRLQEGQREITLVDSPDFITIRDPASEFKIAHVKKHKAPIPEN